MEDQMKAVVATFMVAAGMLLAPSGTYAGDASTGKSKGMKSITSGMSEDDVAIVSEYFSSLK
jgi:hypothetical protein